MMPSPCPDQPLRVPPPTADHRPHQAYYRPSATGKGDVFLFSPSLCSRNSKESTLQSSRSFDAFSYTYSPANDLHPTQKPRSPPFLTHPQSLPSPLFVEAYLSGLEPKSIARDSPGTPFQQLFNSSPAGYWQDDHNSLSPISRNSSISGPSSQHSVQDSETENVDCASRKTKFESLLEYEKSHSVPDSPVHRPSTPSSLSSLSSLESSPSALFSRQPHLSSQTSCGRTACWSSPGQTDDGAPSSLLSSLGSPIKLAVSPSSFASTRFYGQRSRRTIPSKPPIAAEILNQLGQPRGRSRLVASLSSIRSPRSPLPVADVDSDDQNYDPSGRKSRKRGRSSKSKPTHNLSSPTPAYRRKRLRTSVPAALPASPLPPQEQPAHSFEAHNDDSKETENVNQAYPNRTFPLRVPIHSFFPLFYRRFPVSSAIDPELAGADRILVPSVPEASSNQPRDAFDLYTPRFVKGKGTSKAGLCPICYEPATRGGEGKKVWLSMKFSAFNYHMQYYHGISAPTGRPFSPPTAFRTIARVNPSKHEKTHIMEGQCHRCRKWVAIEGVKDVEAKVREIFWWKHAAGCHQGDVLEGESDVFVEDAVWAALSGNSREMQAERGEMGEGDGEDESEED
ncbi:hypothetical protein V8D89_015881 [Ganoderma adspersum]